MSFDPPLPRHSLAHLFFLFALMALAAAARAGEATVAVASNFTAPAKEIGALFERATGHRAVLSFGATGQLYTQIAQGAPYDVFLAADQDRPALAVKRGLAVRNSLHTYAKGRLALFSRERNRVRDGSALLGAGGARVAIANPVTAPYGAAAIEAMRALGVYDALKPRLVRGTNITQAFQFVYTGNAELGFVALSQLKSRPVGSHWVLPADLYPAIAQDAVLLRRGENNEAALAFLAFLQGDAADAVKEKYGYGAGR